MRISASRFRLFVMISVGIGLTACGGPSDLPVAAVPGDWVEVLSYDFSKPDTSWNGAIGIWEFSDGVVTQTSTSEKYPVALWDGPHFSDLDLSVDFRTISGKVDASGGLVFRAQDQNNYYVVRANSLEGNLRLYTVSDGDRKEIASVDVDAPALGETHQLRVVAIGTQIQAYLNGELLLGHRDDTFTSGFVGLWTKADAVTEFDNLAVRAAP